VVKILDFGLAKSAGESSAASGSNLTMSPTLSLAMTRAGMILGTAAYMSPEQAPGMVVDKRTDIWAFGVVLYEIVTGKRLFEGEDLTETLASVVKDRPDLSGVPANVRRLLERCLEKDPKKRLRDIGDMELLLGEEAELIAPSRSRLGYHKRWLWPAVAAVLVAALGVALWALWRATQPVDRPLVRLDVDLGADVSLPSTSSTSTLAGSSVAISPDGTRLPGAGGTIWEYSLHRGCRRRERAGGFNANVSAAHACAAVRLPQNVTLLFTSVQLLAVGSPRLKYGTHPTTDPRRIRE
jgi:serine/threonine protein kinase